MTLGINAHALFAVRVEKLQAAAQGVLALRLAPVDGMMLPDFTPGAHIDVYFPNGLVRQYSLIDNGPFEGAYRLGIGLAMNSRGGSHYAHNALKPGAILHISAPRNHFALDPSAERSLFIAGGIGITPILAMAKRCSAHNHPWRVLYSVQKRDKAAFLDSLQALPGGEVHLHVDEEAGQPPDLEQWLGTLKPGEHVYCCGPSGMMSRVQSLATPADLPRVHFEWFAPPAQDAATPDGAFDVLMRRSGRTIHVPADVSVLEALENAGENVPFGCREGLCGSCITTVCAGELDHRDLVLSDAERASGQQMLICVSRAHSALLELDL